MMSTVCTIIQNSNVKDLSNMTTAKNLIIGENSKVAYCWTYDDSNNLVFHIGIYDESAEQNYNGSDPLIKFTINSDDELFQFHTEHFNDKAHLKLPMEAGVWVYQ